VRSPAGRRVVLGAILGVAVVRAQRRQRIEGGPADIRCSKRGRAKRRMIATVSKSVGGRGAGRGAARRRRQRTHVHVLAATKAPQKVNGHPHKKNGCGGVAHLRLGELRWLRCGAGWRRGGAPAQDRPRLADRRDRLPRRRALLSDGQPIFRLGCGGQPSRAGRRACCTHARGRGRAMGVRASCTSQRARVVCTSMRLAMRERTCAW
jgi:hypothetical protein